MPLAETIEAQIRAGLQILYPQMDLGPGSPAAKLILDPVRAILGPDALDTPPAEFMRARLQQELPSLATDPGSAITATLLDPLLPLLEPLQREVQALYGAYDLTSPDRIPLEVAEDIASNFFIGRRMGTYATGRVRVYFPRAAGVFVQGSARFSTESGQVFAPTSAQSYPVEVVSRQRDGAEFYVDVDVLAADRGAAGGVPSGTIRRVSGVPGASRCTNLTDITPGEDADTAESLLSRVRGGLTEESLTTRRGIMRRLYNTFGDSLRQVEVTGAGDPEMQRDVLEADSTGAAVASGVSFLVGTIGIFFCTWEGPVPADEGSQIRVGDRLDLNLWPYLYPTENLPGERNQQRTVAEVIFDSRQMVAGTLPSVLLLRFDTGLDTAAPTHPGIPGVLPGVFFLATRPGAIRIGGLPDGLQTAAGNAPLEVASGEVHLGGRADVWVRGSSADTATGISGVLRSPGAVVEGTSLYTNGYGDRGENNHLHREIRLTLTGISGTIGAGDVVRGLTSLFMATVLARTSSSVVLGSVIGTPEVGETIRAKTSGATATVSAVSAPSWEDDGVAEGDAVVILDGADTGTYRVLYVDGPHLWVDSALSSRGGPFQYRVVRQSAVSLFSPRTNLLPFGDYGATDLSTVVGVATVATRTNLQLYGVKSGDTLEILDGPDAGAYTVRGFDRTRGGLAPILDRAPGSTQSGLAFRVYRSGAGLPRPLMRLAPGGVQVVDASGRPTGTQVPPAAPVEARALRGFSGSHRVAAGTGGFVLPDPGWSWAPTGPRVGDAGEYPGVETCLSDGCVTGDGVIAVCTLLEDGTFSLSANLPSGVAALVENVKAFLLSLDDSFGFGAEFRALIEGMVPIRIGEPDTSTSSIVLQYEILLPWELFDGVQNTWVALPDIDWPSLFAQETSAGALELFRAGAYYATTSALASAQPGDALVVASGANSGAYVIHEVHTYALATAASIVDGVGSRDRAYKIVTVTIKGEFPAAAVGGLADFFSGGGLADLATLPAPPAWPGTAVDPSGTYLSPWQMVGTGLDWLFQWLNSLGFDLPTSFEMEPTALLEAVWGLLFTPYSVERPSGPSPVRLYFSEPTSITVFPHLPTASWVWDAPNHQPALESAWITLPLPELDGTQLTLYVDGEELTTLAGPTLSACATISDLADLLQLALDASGVYVTVAGPASASGQITITGYRTTAPSPLEARAAYATDTFRLLGFYADHTGTPPEITASDEPTAATNPFISPIVKATGASGGFRLTHSTLAFAEDIDVYAFLADGTYWYTDAAVVQAVEDAVNAAISGSGGVLGLVCVVSVVDGALVLSFTGDPRGTGGVLAVEVPSLVPPITGELFGEVLPSVVVPVTGTITLTAEPAAQFTVTVSGTGTETWTDTVVYAGGQLVALQDAVVSYHADGDTSPIAAALNAAEARGWAAHTTRYQWVGGAGRALSVRSLDGLEGATLTTAEADLLDALGVPATTETGGGGDGTATTGEEYAPTGDVREHLLPDRITRFWTTSGTRLLEYVACVEPGTEPWRTILPAVDGDGTVPISTWPRDLEVLPTYEGAKSAGLRFTDTLLPSPGQAGVRPGDILEVHAQRALRAPSPSVGSVDGIPDVLVCVRTQLGSPVLRLPAVVSPTHTFISPEEGGAAVSVGDYVAIETGPDVGLYTVVAVAAESLTLDTPLGSSTANLLRSGKDASLSTGSVVVRIPTTHATFAAADVGRWITLWGGGYAGSGGTWRITQVARVSDGSDWVWELTLDTEDPFTHDEDDMHWALVAPPAEDPGSGYTGYSTELIGVVPIRIYRGTADTWRVCAVSPGLDRGAARVRVALDEVTLEVPAPGVRAPYRIVRPGEIRIPVSQMRTQREGSQWYADVWAQSLGGSPEHNLEAGARLEPVRGTYVSDGYWLETEDTRYTFSSREETTLYCSPFLLPVGAADGVADLVAVEGQQLSWVAEWSSLANAVAGLLSGPSDRPLCADLLVRVFLPSYVSIDVTVRSGYTSAAQIAEDLRAYVTGLSSVDGLDVSVIEQSLARQGVTYAHPISVVTVTHDLDRNMVGARSADLLNDVDIPYHGTDRVTAWIPGADRSTYPTPAQAPAGEWVRITRGVARFSG